ncbi:MFS transporter [Actinokineospora sp. 24-640]
MTGTDQTALEAPAAPEAAPAGPAPPPTPAPDPHRWRALGVLLVATFMDLLDVNIVTVAIPSIQGDLAASAAAIQWSTAGYTLCFAVVLITGGRLGDIFGRKRMFLTGVIAFTAASLLCALAQSPEALIGARVLQGLAAAVMVPQVLALIHVTFAREEVGKVVSLYAGMAGLAIVAGPVLGGLLVQWDPFGLEWRSIFAVNLPVGVAAVIGAMAWMRESKSPHARKLDLVGTVLGIVGLLLLLLLLPLMQGRELGWPAWTIVSLVLSVPVLGLFVLHQRRLRDSGGLPLLALGLFKSRGFATGVAAQLLFSCVPAGFFISWTLYLQAGLGWSALQTGLTIIPFSIGVPVAGGLAVRHWFPRLGRRRARPPASSTPPASSAPRSAWRSSAACSSPRSRASAWPPPTATASGPRPRSSPRVPPRSRPTGSSRACAGARRTPWRARTSRPPRQAAPRWPKACPPPSGRWWWTR